MRYCYTWEQFDTAAGAIAEGIALRVPISPHVTGIMRNMGPDGTEQEWTLFAVCFEALLASADAPDTPARNGPDSQLLAVPLVCGVDDVIEAES